VRVPDGLDVSRRATGCGRMARALSCRRPPGGRSSLDARAGKLYGEETASRIAAEAIHILGGYGYMEEYTVKWLARDAKLLELGGSTTETQILAIARQILAS